LLKVVCNEHGYDSYALLLDHWTIAPIKHGQQYMRWQRPLIARGHDSLGRDKIFYPMKPIVELLEWSSTAILGIVCR